MSANAHAVKSCAQRRSSSAQALRRAWTRRLGRLATARGALAAATTAATSWTTSRRVGRGRRLQLRTSRRRGWQPLWRLVARGALTSIFTRALLACAGAGRAEGQGHLHPASGMELWVCGAAGLCVAGLPSATATLISHAVLPPTPRPCLLQGGQPQAGDGGGAGELQGCERGGGHVPQRGHQPQGRQAAAHRGGQGLTARSAPACASHSLLASLAACCSLPTATLRLFNLQQDVIALVMRAEETWWEQELGSALAGRLQRTGSMHGGPALSQLACGILVRLYSL